jgi:hypothetical protein
MHPRLGQHTGGAVAQRVGDLLAVLLLLGPSVGQVFGAVGGLPASQHGLVRAGGRWLPQVGQLAGVS